MTRSSNGSLWYWLQCLFQCCPQKLQVQNKCVHGNMLNILKMCVCSCLEDEIETQMQSTMNTYPSPETYVTDVASFQNLIKCRTSFQEPRCQQGWDANLCAEHNWLVVYRLIHYVTDVGHLWKTQHNTKTVIMLNIQVHRRGWDSNPRLQSTMD